LITDSNGIPLSVLIQPGNISDQSLLFSNMDDMLTDITYNFKNNKHKRYMLADSIYDTRDIRDKIKSYNIVPIIWPNKRNTKNKELLKIKKLNSRHKKIYKKRIIIENTFSWIYKNRRTCKRYDKLVINYMSFLYMALIKIILKRI